ncbi:MAG: hypothetical protein GTO14_06225 [Anaerolineales bacterium]|nr:hypothetical protein [Anaerolineales bacterium]
MAKKRSKKRVRRPNLPPETFQAIRTAESPSVAPSKRDFNPDYAHVVKDLKRIGLLAGFFIVLLVVLSIFLN